MATSVVTGATLQCTFGTMPGSLMVTSQMKTLAGNMPMATVMDAMPGANITPFGMCTSMANPQVAAATSAALGVLTPVPCTMAPAGVWPPKKPTVLIGGNPCLTNDCQLHCALGQGTIAVVSPGQTKCNML